MSSSAPKKKLSKKQRDARKKRKMQESTQPAGVREAVVPLLSSNKKRKVPGLSEAKKPSPKKQSKFALSNKTNKQQKNGKKNQKGGQAQTGGQAQKGGQALFTQSSTQQLQEQTESDSDEDDIEGTWDTRKPSKIEKIDLEAEGIDQEEDSEELDLNDSDDDEDEEEDDDDDDSEEDEIESPNTGVQKDGAESANDSKDHALSAEPVTLYVNQLPFDSTKEQIVSHFSRSGVMDCRMCLDKHTKSFRGTAFVVVKNGPLGLSLHLSKMGSRMINVRPQLSQTDLAAVAEKGQSIKRNIAKQQGQSHKGKKVNRGGSGKPPR